ncbi:hypothetical protein EYM_06995 [Ignicoccus islandicus DSM 13165]|uniref:UPF0201 protein EYM_06995 n=1 Tax=Ignicoccus islandicus DSM 13165 TaxID=940295 RepID=A0A0U3DWW6_9CREN|nr:RNA-binding domain-containing protein [Ignicoccus islandicus]ALU11994.1 hypothetical protein EYM_06995 [Ignicoccus islandicus DSM 13165]
MLIRIETEVRPTEDERKVLKALKRLFNAEFQLIERGEGWKSFVAECSDKSCLEPLRAAIIGKALSSTFKSMLRSLIRGSDFLIFKLNKQAAFAGVPSFAEEDVDSPMGPITVEVTGSKEELIELINWLVGEESGSDIQRDTNRRTEGEPLRS